MGYKLTLEAALRLYSKECTMLLGVGRVKLGLSKATSDRDKAAIFGQLHVKALRWLAGKPMVEYVPKHARAVWSSEPLSGLLEEIRAQLQKERLNV